MCLSGAFAHREAAVTTGVLSTVACVLGVGRERQRAQRTGHGAEPRRHDELREALFELRRLDVTIEAALELLLDALEQMRLRAHDAAAEKDARRRGGQHHGVHELRRAHARRNPTRDDRAEVARPACRRALRWRDPRPGLRCSRRGTDRCRRNVSPGLARHADVAELGVVHAEHRTCRARWCPTPMPVPTVT